MLTTKQLVIKTLSNNEELKDWYEAEHNFSLETAESYNYSTTTSNSITDLIIEDGIKYGVITKEEAGWE